ncbi:uncharacterized protein PFL1_03006 [Pseudozyma flocculosa PF-1]|uniref:Ribosomal RNA-processing protein 40 n=2 Tax=Pseudozyma flocculosa TaxID=84751 RepID=A0A5C3F0F4_9BASI|nr:uncharacterized protein PFL1_03006 [Pseudozyma flocculosa PF-1]EPQ29251.1 hypothetical protein PFL1_03006 [Pseudozyma flocculosa PF-1]SPO37752.1 related to RRP40 - protein involved in ribosomal RNA processing, component of the exosome complex [Pseudozyma flocculosa]
MTVVLPGDTISLASTSTLPLGGGGGGGGGAIKLGPGLLPSPTSPHTALTAIRPGALGHLSSAGSGSGIGKSRSSEGWWVETNTTRYVPAPNDSIIGQITNKGAESYTVHLSAAHSAILPVLSFEGATKRHKPNLAIGTLVYARLLSADRFTEPELTCIDPQTGKAEGYGELTATNARGVPQGVAMAYRVSTGLARSLVRPKHDLLRTVAKSITFEAAIGVNGFVWIRAANVAQVVAVGKILKLADQHAVDFDSSRLARPADDRMHTDDDDDDEVEGWDADEIVRHRASLDAKTIKAILNESL